MKSYNQLYLYLSSLLILGSSIQHLHAMDGGQLAPQDAPAGQASSSMMGDWGPVFDKLINVASIVGDNTTKAMKAGMDGIIKVAEVGVNFTKEQLDEIRRRADAKRKEIQGEIHTLNAQIVSMRTQLTRPNLTDAQRKVLEDQLLDYQTSKTQKEAALTTTERAAEELQKELTKTMGEVGKNFAEGVKETMTTVVRGFVPDVTAIAQGRIKAAEEAKASIVNNARRIAFLSNPVTLGAVTASVVGTYYGLKFGYQVVEDWYKVPELAEKTTLVSPLTKFWRFIFDIEVFNTTLDDVVLNPALTATFKNYVVSTKHCIDNGGNLRPLLMPGPPGTGKTTLGFALAGELGIDAIYFNAGKLKNCALDVSLRRLDQLFKKAENGDRPILIIIDEAEVVFKHRDSKDLSEDTKMIQNTLMAKLGTPQNDFIIIALTNRPQDFDPAFISRFNNRIIEILPPVFEQRLQMVDMYIEKYLVHPTFKAKTSLFDKLFSEADPVIPTIDEDVFTPEHRAAIGHKIDGFSGRDISNLFMDIYNEAAATPDMHITKAMADAVVDAMVKSVEKYVVPQPIQTK